MTTDLVQHAEDALLALHRHHVLSLTEGVDVKPGLEAESEKTHRSPRGTRASLTETMQQEEDTAGRRDGPRSSVPLEIIEDLRQQEVEEGPELGQVVLQRRAGQQQLVVGGETLQLPHQPTVEVLDPVALVHNQVLPLVALKQRRKGKESIRTGRISCNVGLSLQ